jgi:hypothetical protein
VLPSHLGAVLLVHEVSIPLCQPSLLASYLKSWRPWQGLRPSGPWQHHNHYIRTKGVSSWLYNGNVVVPHVTIIVTCGRQKEHAIPTSVLATRAESARQSIDAVLHTQLKGDVCQRP